MSFKRRVLSAFPRPDLLELGRQFDLAVTTRMTTAELIDVIAGSKRARLAELVTEAMSRDQLKAICAACGLDTVGKEKATLVERILEAAEPSTAAPVRGASDEVVADYSRRASSGAVNARAANASRAAEGAAPYGRAADVPSTRGRAKRATDRRRAGVPESEAFVSGSLKAALRQFALAAAGGYSGREAGVSFATHLLECFGWPDGRPDGAEIPRTFAIAEGGVEARRDVAVWWPERRAILAVVAHDAVLDFSWRELLRVCLQVSPSPQYVVLTNQRDLQLYDLARDRDAPRLSIPIDALPKYSEAFPFFAQDWVPGATPKIVNVEKVSAEVADLVAKLYRSVRAKHRGRDRDVTRFILQCILAMFAEDIGLLPANYFTSLLYDGARNGDVDQRLRQLFVQMNTRDLPEPRVVPYFNGGLFNEVVLLPLGSEQLVALTKAAEANWTHVDPHIFGSVFQGVMDDAERHASGAHYTAKDDIMRVVGPTIVEPWRRRIQAATSLRELTELRKELFAYRVLDPACGSGNFLYIAFRELYRLDTELLSRMREFPSTHGKLSWNGGIATTNFYGIDINEFAVELAKVTLNIAKKIAFEERRQQALALAGQVELDIDPSLPLDNLENNVVCADALFTTWPQVEVIVGNPPFLGGLKIRSELGETYLEKLQQSHPGVNGRADLCAFWFRKAHDHLQSGGRAGLVATNTIREGNTREAAGDYLISRGGTIVNAVSSQVWPGESFVFVSMLNWVNGPATDEPRRLFLDGKVFEPKVISPSLQVSTDLGGAAVLTQQGLRCAVGVQLGTKEFQIDNATAREIHSDRSARAFLKPIAIANHLLRGRLSDDPDYVIDMSRCATEAEAKKGGAAYEYLREHVFPVVREKARLATTEHYRNWLKTWWRPIWPRTDFFDSVRDLNRVIVCSRHAARPVFEFMSPKFFPTESMQVFALADDYSYGILQSRHHWEWALGIGSKIGESTRYTGEVWETFPWPQEPGSHHVSRVVQAGRALRSVRNSLMLKNRWSLRDLYQSADVPGNHPLNVAQADLDDAVREAYGMPSAEDVTEFLLDLNRLLAEDKALKRPITEPGLPKTFDSTDPQWISDDCIRPPSW